MGSFVNGIRGSSQELKGWEVGGQEVWRWGDREVWRLGAGDIFIRARGRSKRVMEEVQEIRQRLVRRASG